MSQKTVTQLNTQVDQTIFPNTTGQIDAQKENLLLKSIIESSVNKSTDAPMDDKTYALKNGAMVDINQSLLYVNKYEPGGNLNFIYNPSTIRGAAVIIPILSAGVLRDCTGLKTKVGFWLSNVVDTDGDPIADISTIKTAYVVLNYKNGVNEQFCPLILKTGVRAQLKDLYQKFTECYFDAAMTWAAPIINGTAESEIAATDPAPSTVETIDPYAEEAHIYEVNDDTKENVTILSNEEGGIVTFPTTLTADKAIFFTVAEEGAGVTVNGVACVAGDVIAASFIFNTTTWTVNKLTPAVIQDFSDISVRLCDSGDTIAMNENGAMFYWRESNEYGGEQSNEGNLVFINNRTTKEEMGIFQVVVAQDVDTGFDLLRRVTLVSLLDKVRVSVGTERGMWINCYDGVNSESITFKRVKASPIDVYTLKATTNSNVAVEALDEYGDSIPVPLKVPYLYKITLLREGADEGLGTAEFRALSAASSAMTSLSKTQVATNTVDFVEGSTPTSTGMTLNRTTGAIHVKAVTTDVLDWTIIVEVYRLKP